MRNMDALRGIEAGGRRRRDYAARPVSRKGLLRAKTRPGWGLAVAATEL
jgi:hypothetical protein